jgi:hypothetical protein
MAARTYKIKSAACVEAISAAATPGTYHHTLSHRLGTFHTAVKCGKDFFVTSGKILKSYLTPIGLFLVVRFKKKSISQLLGHCIQQGRKHLSCIAKTPGRINCKSLLDKLHHCQIRSFA